MSTKKPRYLVIIKPDGTEERKEFKARPPYEALRDAVGGIIEGVKVRYDGKVREAYVHEEGLLINLPYNHRATEAYRAYWVPKGARPMDCHLVGPLAVII